MSATGTGFATSITLRPDYSKLVEAFDGRGRSPERPEEVVPAIREASTPPTAGPILMDVLLSE